METKNYMYIVKTARWQENWSQRDLAKAAGVSPTSVQKIEQGGSVRVKTLQKVLKVLNIDEEITEQVRKKMLQNALEMF